jgi:UDP-glucose 4-epimerase
MKNKILITGVAGFIGSNLLDYLIKNTDYNIVGYDNLETGCINNIQHNLDNERFNFVNKSVLSIFTLKEFKYIFHLAALPRIQPSYDQISHHINNNLLLGINLVEIMIKEDHYPKLINSSSSSIYGNPDEVPTTEKCKPNCLNPYSFQKYEFEKYLEILSIKYPLNYVNLRYFNPYGERSFNPLNKFNAYSSVIGIFLNQKKRGQSLTIVGDGNQKRDFIHVSDICKANYMAAINNKSNKLSFNLGSGNPISIIEVAKMISEDIKFLPPRIGEADITHASIELAYEIFEWKPEYQLSQYLLSQNP